MKYVTNNFGLNMVELKEDYSIDVEFMSELAFKVEIKSAKNRLSQLDVSQQLVLFSPSGIIDATFGDDIYVAQYFDGELIFRKLTIRRRYP